MSCCEESKSRTALSDSVKSRRPDKPRASPRETRVSAVPFLLSALSPSAVRLTEQQPPACVKFIPFTATSSGWSAKPGDFREISWLSGLANHDLILAGETQRGFFGVGTTLELQRFDPNTGPKRSLISQSSPNTRQSVFLFFFVVLDHIIDRVIVIYTLFFLKK